MKKEHQNLLDSHKFDEYLEFLKTAGTKKNDEAFVLHSHHIVPKFMDEEREWETSRVFLTVEDHAHAHMLLGECFPPNSTQRLGNLRSGKLISKNSIKYKAALLEIYENQRGDNNPSKLPENKKKISEGLKKYYSKHTNPKGAKSYEEIYGDRAEEEKRKRSKRTRTRAEYILSSKKAAETKKLNKSQSRSKNPQAKEVEVDAISFGCIRDAEEHFGKSCYLLKKHHNFRYL